MAEDASISTKLTFIDDDNPGDAPRPARFAPPTSPPLPGEEPPQADSWPPEADDLADVLRVARRRLLRAKRLDIVLCGALVALLVGLMVLQQGEFWLFILCPFAALIATAVYVPFRLRPRRAALAEIAARQKLIDPQCPQCGYLLRHLQRPRCPECGRRVTLPSPRQVREALAGGTIAVAQVSIVSELGTIVGLLMLVVAMSVGKLVGPAAGWWSAAAIPMVFLVILAVGRRRAAARVPPFAVCDRCGKSTDIHANNCAHCQKPLLAEHVYVKPGLRGQSDPRLYCTWAQLAGGACVATMLVIIGMEHADMVDGVGKTAPWVLPCEVALIVATIALLQRDMRLTSPKRLELLDSSIDPLCHGCLNSLGGFPANGACGSCQREYRGIELAGGLRDA